MSWYSDLLKSPEWQKKRLKLLEAANWECQVCGSGKKQLQVHHRTYKKGAAPWEYDDRDFSVLCDDHHAAVTWEKKRLAEVLDEYERLNLPLLAVIGYVGAAVSSASDSTIETHSTEEAAGVAALVGCSVDDVLEARDVGSCVVDVTKLILDRAGKCRG